MSHGRKKTASGFTLVEVMIAIGVMTIGSLGILSMHQAVSGANRTAREMNTALAITERWIERVERDALGWTEPEIDSSELAGTNYLSAIHNSVAPTAWFTPTIVNGQSYGFEFDGTDTEEADDMMYCVNLRVSWVRQGRSARVDVRTFWYRPGHMPRGAKHSKWVSGSSFRSAACNAAAADGWDLGVAPNVNVIFASTVVSWLRLEGV